MFTLHSAFMHGEQKMATKKSIFTLCKYTFPIASYDYDGTLLIAPKLARKATVSNSQLFPLLHNSDLNAKL